MSEAHSQETQKPKALPKPNSDFYQFAETLKWTTPRVVEMAVGLEINAYACADPGMLHPPDRRGKSRLE